jgi:hypothetical protein
MSLFRTIARNAATTTAVASLLLAFASFCVAGLSLYFTINAQKDDRQYKELLLKPNLQVEASSHEYSVTLLNNGLGPAEVQDVLYYDGWGCIELLAQDRQSFDSRDYYKIIDALRKRFATRVASVPWKGNKVDDNDYMRIFIPLPKGVLGVGPFTLFAIHDPEAFRSKLDALGAQTALNFNLAFVEDAFSLPFSISYCSLSGRYCKVSLERSADFPCSFR